MQRIGIDMDEVLGDTLAHQLAWLKQHRQVELSRDALQPGEKPHHRVEAQHIDALEKVMHQGDWFLGIPVMPDSQRVVAELYEKYEVFIVTAAMDYPKSCHAKIDWLQQHFPFVSLKRLVLCGNKEIFNGDYLIDDSSRHLNVFGGHGVLYDAPHNRKVTAHERVRSWPEVAERFLR